MTLDQWKALQLRILDTQRLAVFLAEQGEFKSAADLNKAVVRMQRIKPTKQEVEAAS